MTDHAIEHVRSFNRAVTERIGALQDEYLARGRPLGASRVLWEIGRDGTDLRALRARLDLDSGYLSRLVRGLERDGLVVVEPGQSSLGHRAERLVLEVGTGQRPDVPEAAQVERRDRGVDVLLGQVELEDGVGHARRERTEDVGLGLLG